MALLHTNPFEADHAPLDKEYGCRKKKTKREEFLEIMEEIIPWEEWVAIIRPYYPTGKRGGPPKDLELMLRMYLL